MLDLREDAVSLDKGQGRSDVQVVRRSKRVLTAEDVAARRAEERELGILRQEMETRTEVPPPSKGSVDSSVSLRHARLGLFAIAVAVLFLAWILQRRKGSD